MDRIELCKQRIKINQDMLRMAKKSLEYWTKELKAEMEKTNYKDLY